MSKVIKAAAVAFAVTFLVVTGAAFLLTGSFAAGTVAATFGASALAMSTLSAVSTLVMGLISKDPEVSSQNFGTKFAGRSPTAPRQIIYGRARVGGTITHMQTSGTDNNLLSIIVVLAGHEVEELETVRVNDTNLTTTSSGGFQYATNSEFTNSDNDNKFGVSNSLLRFRFKDGSQTTADSTIVGATNLGNSDKFTSCAYVLVQMVFDSEKFSSLPNLSFIVKGKKVYDPRNPSAAPAFSTNPALCIRDYLTDTQYGLKAKDSEILDTTAIGGFAGAANTCDTPTSLQTATVSIAQTNSTTIPITSSGLTLIKAGDTVTGSGITGTVTVTQRRGNNVFLDTAVTVAQGVTLSFGQPAYTANGLADFSTNGKAVLEGLLSSCAGKFSYVNGRFLMFAGASVTPEMTIEDDNVLSPISINTKSGQGESYNQVKSVFVDSNQNFTATDTPLYSDSTFLANDTPSGESNVNYKKTMELQHPFTDNATTAQRLNRISLNYSRQDMTCSVTTDLGYLQLQPFDVVRVTNSRLGFTNKQFEVINQKITIVGDQKDGAGVLGVQFELKEYDASIYTFAQSSYDVPPDSGDPDDTSDSSISAPAIASLTQVVTEEGAGFKNDIKVALTLQGHDKIIGTEIQYKLSTDSDYTGDLFIGKGVASALIPNVVIGKTYNVRAKHIANDGVTSDYSAASNITISDPSSISAPSNFSATGHPVGILLSWTNPNNHNLRAIKVYRHTANFTPTDDTYLVDTLMGEPNAIMRNVQGSMDGLTSGTTYFFAARAITNTGVHSAFTSVDSASFLLDKSVVNLNNLGDLDSTANTKLGTIEENATVGAKAGTNLKDSGNQTINDLDIKNDELSIDFTGNTTFRLRKGSGGSITNIDTQAFTKTNVGLSDLASLDSTSSTKLGTIEENATVGATAGSNLKDSGGNTLNDNAVKNSSITLATDGSLQNIGTTQILSNAKIAAADIEGSGKAFPANSVTKLGGIEANATVGATAGTNLKESDGSVLGDAAVKNASITLAADGSLENIGTSQVLSNSKIVEADLVGADKTFAAGQKPNKTVLNGNNLEVDGTSQGAVKNSALSLSLSGSSLSLTGGGGSAQTFDKGSVGLSDLNSLQSGSGTKLAGIENNATFGAQIGTNLVDEDENNVNDVDLLNSSLVIAKSGQNIQIKKGSTQIDSVAIDKSTVGLSDLASLDSTSSTKLGTIETNATVGAKAGTNLKDSSNNSLGDADVITVQGTANDTNNVNSVAKADVTSAITGTQTNVASVVSGLAAGTQAINAGSLNAGQINTSLLKLDELFLPTEGTATSGQTVNFFSTMTQVSLGSIGDGAGFYMGTVSVEITDAQNDRIRGASFHIDLKSGFSTVYTKYWPIGIKEGNQYYDAGDAFGHSADLPVMHLEFAYFHTSNTALNLFVNADSNDTTTTCLVKARAVRFGAETVTFNPTSVAAATVPASTQTTFASVTVSGFTGTKTVNLSGNSTAEISVNSGSFVSSSIPAISANQTFQVRMTSSATAGAVRTATVEIGGTAITFTLTTQGTYTPTYSGGGGSGSAGGGFESTTQLN